MPVVSYTTKQWEWDEAKFQMKTPLRDLSEGISLRISSLDEELKLKVTELNNVKGSVQGMERKTQGNLMVRGLADLIFKEDVVESEYMTTVFVVVQKVRGVAEQHSSTVQHLRQSPHTSTKSSTHAHTPLPLLALVLQSSTKEFEESYERMAKYVVPKSGKLISEDSEYALYTWYAAAKPSRSRTCMASAQPYTPHLLLLTSPPL